VRHRKERKSKCSLQPLLNHEGIEFFTYPHHLPTVPENYIRLDVNAPVLSPEDADKGLLLLDGTWKLVEPMNKLYSHVPGRSLPPLQTAYPRVSKVFNDPDNGLASIEALALSYYIMGRPWEDLLEEYHWKERFIELNRDFFATA
jgi:pre-rRNA-processing protein TSR3